MQRVGLIRLFAGLTTTCVALGDRLSVQESLILSKKALRRAEKALCGLEVELCRLDRDSLLT